MEKTKKIKLFIGLSYIILVIIFLLLFFSKFSLEEISSYDFIKDNINITDMELTEIFNCGIGMIFVINKKHQSKFIKRNLFNLIGEIT